MKKKLIIILSAAMALVLAAGGFLFFVFGLGKTPLEDMKASDIVSIKIQSAPPYEEAVIANQGEISQFAEKLKAVTVYEERTVIGDSEKPMIFTITKSDGTEITVKTFNPYISIDNTTYRVKSETSEALSGLGEDFLSIEEQQ